MPVQHYRRTLPLFASPVKPVRPRLSAGLLTTCLYLFRNQKWSRALRILPLLLVFLIPGQGRALEAHRNIADPVASIEAANRICIKCHAQAAADLRQSVHWTWLRTMTNNGSQFANDLRTDLSRFGLSAASNPGQCLRCHISALPENRETETEPANSINCLVCHDTTGRYGAGVSAKELTGIVQQAGLPMPRNCRTCHDRDCGLAPAGIRPDSTTDIHMVKYGFTCQQCHPGLGRHSMARRLENAPREEATGSGCSACHGNSPHRMKQLNRHGRFVACQSCHIPGLASRNPVVLEWNWLIAGGVPRLWTIAGNPVLVDGFMAGSNIRPQYWWTNGKMRVYRRGERITGNLVVLCQPGSRAPDSLIMPFRTITATQLKDRKYHYLLSPLLTGKHPPFWTTASLNQAIGKGMAAMRLPFSGETAPVTSLRYEQINHGVVRASDALGCMDCHGAHSHFPWQDLGYRQDPWMDQAAPMPQPVAAPPAIGLPPIEEDVLVPDGNN